MVRITKADVEEIMRLEEERIKENPWDQDGPDLRVFTAIMADSIAKFTPMIALSVGLLIVSGPGNPTKEQADRVLKHPILISSMAKAMYIAYLAGKVEASHEPTTNS